MIHAPRAFRHQVAVGLGASLGDRRGALELAVRRLDATPRVTVKRVSHWVRTPPLAGGSARNWFLNGVARVTTDLDPESFLALCIRLEDAAGRRRALRWGDRPLDLDLLLVDQIVVRHDRLSVPHPRIAHRRFVLEPLLEVWPGAVDPVAGVPFGDLPSAPGPRPTPVGLLARGRRLRYL